MVPFLILEVSIGACGKHKVNLVRLEYWFLSGLLRTISTAQAINEEEQFERAPQCPKMMWGGNQKARRR